MKVKQTAGRDSLGDFAPAFARLNDDVLFGEVWAEETLSLKTRSLLTVSALVTSAVFLSTINPILRRRQARLEHAHA